MGYRFACLAMCLRAWRLWSRVAPPTRRRSPASSRLRCGWAIFPAGSTLPVHAALAKGIFERNGLRVEFTEGTDLPVFIAALAKGQYDIVMSVPTLVMIGVEKGLDLQIISSLQRSSSQRPNAVWISKDPTVESLEQLKGKTIAVPSLTGIIIDATGTC